jgi:hypothetical protein
MMIVPQFDSSLTPSLIICSEKSKIKFGCASIKYYFGALAAHLRWGSPLEREACNKGGRI